MSMSDNNRDFLKELNNEVGTELGQPIKAADPAPVERRGQRQAKRNGLQLSNSAIRWIAALIVVVLLFGGTVGGYFILRENGRRILEGHIAVEGVEITAPEEAIIANGGDTISWKGVTYQKKSTVLNILCLGIDRNAEMPTEEDEITYGNGGQADTIFLAAFDTATGALTLLNISRDSIVDVDVYNADGEYVGTESMQICLAYAYGDGAHSSCMNEVKAVSKLMYGIPIDAYAAMDLPAVSILNDAVGGVEVEVLEDLSNRDPALTKGSVVLLQGNLAEIYVRSRNRAELESNSQRMARQKQYAAAFVRKAFTKVREDWTVALTLLQAVEAYSCTSVGVSQILYLTSLAALTDFSEKNIVTIPGEVVMGDAYAEYHVDDEALFQIIIDTYYQEVS